MNRAAIENEKKTRASNLEHRRAMGRYMSSMAQELVKLQAELASAEKRAADAAAAPAAANPSNSTFNSIFFFFSEIGLIAD